MDDQSTNSSPQSSQDPWRFIREFPWETTVIWAIFLLVLWATRDFFAIWLFTFFISYTVTNFVNWICRKGHFSGAKSRRIATVGVFAVFIIVMVMGILSLMPILKDQASGIIDKVTQDDFKQTLRDNMDGMGKRIMGEQWFKETLEKDGLNKIAFDDMWKWLKTTQQKKLGEEYADVLKKTMEIAFQFLLSMIFSFLIVWDIPRLQKKVSALAEGGLHRFYEVIGPGLVMFCRLLGRAFQAQFFIALCNTGLTGIGLLFLGLGEWILPLIVIVFVCSFIPVLGVIISSVPIAITALIYKDVNTMILALGLILIVHTLEAYVINPRIMGDMLHMHPVIVLLILLVGEHFAGVWGLLLGVPLTNFIYMYFITKKRERDTEILKKSELGHIPESG